MSLSGVDRVFIVLYISTAFYCIVIVLHSPYCTILNFHIVTPSLASLSDVSVYTRCTHGVLCVLYHTAGDGHYLNRVSCQMFLMKAQRSEVIKVRSKVTRRTGFRPYASDIGPRVMILMKCHYLRTTYKYVIRDLNYIFCLRINLC